AEFEEECDNTDKTGDAKDDGEEVSKGFREFAPAAVLQGCGNSFVSSFLLGAFRLHLGVEGCAVADLLVDVCGDDVLRPVLAKKLPLEVRIELVSRRFRHK